MLTYLLLLCAYEIIGQGFHLLHIGLKAWSRHVFLPLFFSYRYKYQLNMPNFLSNRNYKISDRS